MPHPKYGKMLERRTVCHAHDEANTSHKGDVVEIMETRPLSKLKRWRIVRIVRLGRPAGLGRRGRGRPDLTQARKGAGFLDGVQIRATKGTFNPRR